MEQLRLRVRFVPRGLTDEREEIEPLVELARQALRARAGGGAGVILRPERYDLVDLNGLGKVPLPHFLAGLTRSDAAGAGPVLAVGIVGRFTIRRRDRPPQPVAVAFLEWADCRWSLWQVLLDANGQEVPDTEIRRSAVEGDPLPDGLGRWWTLGRRLKMTLQLGPAVRPFEPSSEVVH
jgi:hypothetical protein